MKRVVTLFMVVGMALLLCACGTLPNSQNKKYEKYQTIIDNLENGNYQNAIDLIENMAKNGDSNIGAATESTEPVLTPEQIAWQADAVGTWIPDKSASEAGHVGFVIKADGSCVVDGKNYTWEIDYSSKTNTQIAVIDGQTKVHMLQLSVNADHGYKRASLFTYTDGQSAQGTVGSYYRSEDYTVIEITADNWQEYFEVKEVIGTSKNAFGEIDRFRSNYCFRLKDTYGTVNSALSSGGVEYGYTSTCQDITMDLENMTYAPVGKVRNTSAHNNTSDWGSATDANNVGYYGISIGGFVASDVNKELTDTVWRPMNIEILRVQGTLYIVK